jgi:hypothetical protein
MEDLAPALHQILHPIDEIPRKKSGLMKLQLQPERFVN